jgi:hypothetical protein
MNMLDDGDDDGGGGGGDGDDYADSGGGGNNNMLNINWTERQVHAEIEFSSDSTYQVNNIWSVNQVDSFCDEKVNSDSYKTNSGMIRVAIICIGSA